MKKYTYLLGWPEHDVWYYGVRTANVVSPEDDLWQRYFSSSTRVADFVTLHGPPSIKQVRRTFENGEEASLFETRVLRRISRSGHWDKWLNMSVGAPKFCLLTQEAKDKLNAIRRTPEYRANMSRRLKGRDITWAHKMRKPKSDTTKMKAAAVARGLDKVECRHCHGMFSKGMHGRWHGDKCKLTRLS